MNKKVYFMEAISLVMLCTLILGGCSDNRIKREKQTILESEKAAEQKTTIDNDLSSKTTDIVQNDTLPEAEITKTDWSEYFDGFNGAAVVYDVSNMKYAIFNSELALTQRSPCSTFKIISSLIALENGIIEPDNSIRKWSGELFWNKDWNHDIDFSEAFRKSCVWYFREVIDNIGHNIMQKELNKLRYGNCDISDWEGRLNTNENNRALTGFWIESSLKISPKEQTEVMERIFGVNSVYSKETQNNLKQVMLVTEENKADIPIYGKTGMGVDYDTAVDAWFTGFAENKGENVYFCVYLGKTDDKVISSDTARKIAIRIMSDYCNN